MLQNSENKQTPSQNVNLPPVDGSLKPDVYSQDISEEGASPQTTLNNKVKGQAESKRDSDLTGDAPDGVVSSDVPENRESMAQSHAQSNKDEPFCTL